MENWSDFKEIETKYLVDSSIRLDFKHIMEEQSLGADAFYYVESDDWYYVNDNDEFLRYRFSEGTKDTRSELTFKRKN